MSPLQGSNGLGCFPRHQALGFGMSPFQGYQTEPAPIFCGFAASDPLGLLNRPKLKGVPNTQLPGRKLAGIGVSSVILALACLQTSSLAAPRHPKHKAST